MGERMNYELPPPGIVRFQPIATGGWALCEGGSIIVASHASMLDLARAVIAEEMRQAIAEDKARYGAQTEQEGPPAGFVGVGGVAGAGGAHTARKIDARAFSDGTP